MKLLQYILIFIMPALLNHSIAQGDTPLLKIEFDSHVEQKYGFDSPISNSWNNAYEIFTLDDSTEFRVPIKSCGHNETDIVSVRILNIEDLNELVFYEDSSSTEIDFEILNDSTLLLSLNKNEEDYYVNAFHKDLLISRMMVKIYKPSVEDIYLISTVGEIDEIDSVSQFLNRIFAQTNIHFHIINEIKYPLKKGLDVELLSNPSGINDRYTEEMRTLRDQFFNANKDLYRNAYLIFIVPGFTDENIKGYMVNNKAMAFIKDLPRKELYHEIARQLLHGVGMIDNDDSKMFEIGTTQNLQDTLGGTELTFGQWQKLRHNTDSYSFYDDDEDVKTNNGLVGFYYWEEDSDGNIEFTDYFLDAIKRPYKKNYLSYHLNIREFMFESVFEHKNIRVCWWHIVIWIGIFITSIIIYARLKIKRKLLQKPFIFRFASKWTIRLSVIFIGYLGYQYINNQLVAFEVNSGLIEEFSGQDYSTIKKSVLNDETLNHKEQDELSSEVFIKKGDDWYMKRRKRVLYFSSIYDSTTFESTIKFVTSKDSLILNKYKHRSLAQSHYIVHNHYDLSGNLLDQKAYNHLGIDISSKLEVQDAAKRILLFVNGYRPTSVGHSFEENFNDVLTNGLEYQNSTNHIYSFDRYNYWRPWNQIDSKFISRINPAETYYADGHFSVSTSNYESVVNFTKASSLYPKRCNDPKNHTCSYYSKSNKSIELLATRSNKRGFKTRKQNGEIAGQNIMMMFNEIPNKSNNDTLYIVAHSMGYAYSLGIIETLRGHINFGGFYIIAPENASAGKVKTGEWQEIWQYGSNLGTDNEDAACLQDGIAPQTCAKGLNEGYRSYIPRQLYKKKGFFESHFVGYYSWIFKLQEKEKGYIKQR